MTLDMAYSYCTGFSKEEAIEIDRRVKKSQEDFARGFSKAAQLSIGVLLFYCLFRTAAQAIESTNNHRTDGPPGPPVENLPEAIEDGPEVIDIPRFGDNGGVFGPNGDYYFGFACALAFFIGVFIIDPYRSNKSN